MCDNSEKSLESIAYCYMGDARNNTANSLFVTGALLGMERAIARHPKLGPPPTRGHRPRTRRRLGCAHHPHKDVHAAVPGRIFSHRCVGVNGRAGRRCLGVSISSGLPGDVRHHGHDGKSDTRFMHCLPAMHIRDTEVGQMISTNSGSAHRGDRCGLESDASIVFRPGGEPPAHHQGVMAATLGHPDGSQP